MNDTRILGMLGRINGEVAVVGSMNADYTVMVDRLPQPGETVKAGPLTILPGGKSGNQAATAARIGANVRLFGAVGDDANAVFLLGKLNEAGVDTSNVCHVSGPSGATVITVDAHGENTIAYSPGSNSRVDTSYIESSRHELTKAKILGLCLESPMDALIAASRIAHESGMTVLVNNSPFMPRLPQELVESTDILLVNEHEMAQMLGFDEPEDGNWDDFDWNEAASRLRESHYSRAIITLGGNGSMVIDHTRTTRIAPVIVDAVDTTGCGDAFMGTVLAGLASGSSLEESATLASFVSAYAATGHGAQASYGTSEQIQDYFECGNNTGSTDIPGTKEA